MANKSAAGKEDSDGFVDVSDDEEEEVEEVDDWEDVDMEDGDLPPLEHVGGEESKESSSFSKVDATKTKTSASFQIVDSASSINDATESASGFSQLSAVIGGKRKGKSRAEAFAELDIQPVELLPGGELKLPSGKVVGHRDFKYIYRQRPRLPDEREAVVINKLAIEYRKARHGPLALTQNQLSKEQRIEMKTNFKEQVVMDKKKIKSHVDYQLKAHKLVKFFRDPTGHLQ